MPSNDLSIFHHENLRPKIQRSVFDLSHRLDCDLDFGKLYPVYVQDCVPNDQFSISVRAFVRSLPLNVPVLSRIRLRTAFFYVPYYLLWHKFDRFIFGGRDGTFVVEPPKLDFQQGSLPDSGSLSEYLGLPAKINLGIISSLPEEDNPTALYHMAFQRIYRDYYLNQDLQTSSNSNAWFPPDDLDFQLSDGVQDATFGDTTIPNAFVPDGLVPPEGDPVEGVDYIDLTAWRYRNFSVDYYTGCMFAPQRGPMQALPVSGRASLSTFTSGLPSNPPLVVTYGSGENRGNLDTPGSDDAVMRINYASSESAAAEEYKDYMSAQMVRYLSQYGINGSDLGTFTIDDIRLATEIQAWLERNMRTKAQYNESLRIHFGDAPVDERLTKPYFIGATSQDIVISEVLQTSETTDNGTPLGTMAGHGISHDKSFVGKFHSHEFGCIIGIASIMPDTSYIQQGIPREWSKGSRYDYYFPEFAQLSPQAVLNKELYVTDDASVNNSAFGYIGRFDEMRFRFDRVCGALANSGMTDFFSYTLARKFNELPTLNSEAFVNSKDNVRHDAWTTGTTMSPFLAEFAFDVRAVRPLPVANIPIGLL